MSGFPSIQSKLSYSEYNNVAPKSQIKKSQICLKIFIIASIVIASIAIVTGVLALMASHGVYPAGLESVGQLNVIGEVNSCVMLIGGIALFILGIIAWFCHVKKSI